LHALKHDAIAIAAKRDEFTRERVPLDWAMTQNNLTKSLAALEKRRETY